MMNKTLMTTLILFLAAFSNISNAARSVEKIVFTQFIGGQREIMIMDVDGSNKTRLTDNAVPGHAPSDMSSSLSRDGRILFTSDPERHGWMSLFLMDTDGSDLQRLTTMPESRKSGMWDANISPDGRHALYASEANGRYAIYSMNIGTGEHRQLTSSGIASTPAWSADGKRIAFISTDNGKTRLWTMHADGSNKQRVTEHAQHDSRPAWSPDSRRLAFVLKDGDRFHIREIDLESKVERTLTDRAGEYSSLSYSPDGHFIVFDGKPEDSRGNVILILSLDTATLTQITDNSADSSQPAWSR